MSKTPPIVRTVEDLRAQVAEWRIEGQTIALVPTMGALHAGHRSLITYAKDRADRVVASIFVNPTQFAPTEDLASYPRDEADDLRQLGELGTDLAYIPSAETMYPENFSTRIDVAGVSGGLCGVSRPHHFPGVATVVCKLFTQCEPELAVFGEKDFQQLRVIQRMARDLDLPVEVLGAPTVREDDGLALSSRNAYLTEDERKIAPMLHRTMTEIADDVRSGRDLEDALKVGRERLEHAGFEIDYLEARDTENLLPLEPGSTENARLFAAAILGKTRLIDNIPIKQ